MKWSWRLARIAGVEVYVHTTFVFLILGVFLWWMLAGEAIDPAREVLFLATIFVASALHEGAHALAARAHGYRTREIVLLPFAGASRLDRRPSDPQHSFLIAAAGPAANGLAAVLVLAGLALAGGDLLALLVQLLADAARFLAPAAGGAASSPPSIPLEFVEVNLAFGLFNLLPAYPMDGGPALRALLAGFLDPPRAARVAGRVGSFVAIALALGGLLASHLVFALLGLFVFLSGRQESSFASARLMLEGLRVRAAMTTRYLTLATYEPLESAASLLLRSTQNDFPVVGDDGRFLGMLTRADLLRGLTERGPMARAIDAARRDGRAVSPDDPLEDLVEQMPTLSQGSVAVIEDGRLVGLLSAEGIQKLLLVRDVTGLSPPAPPPGS